MVGLDLGREAAGGEIILRAIAPVLGKPAVANEMEILKDTAGFEAIDTAGRGGHWLLAR